MIDSGKEVQRRHFDHQARALGCSSCRRDSLMALHERTYYRYVHRLPLRDHDRVLEIGFAHIQLIRLLEAEADYAGVGLDLSHGMASRASRQGGRMRFLVGDAESLPFSSGTFDKVFLISVLEHVPDQDRALLEVHRVLRIGGSVLAQFPVRDNFLSHAFFYRSFFPGRYSRIMQELAHDPARFPDSRRIKEYTSSIGFSLQWERRDEIFFQPIYDYYVLRVLDQLKRWKDSVRRARPSGTEEADIGEGDPVRWRPRPRGIHRCLMPLASPLLLADRWLGACGIGADLWLLLRKER